VAFVLNYHICKCNNVYIGTRHVYVSSGASLFLLFQGRNREERTKPCVELDLQSPSAVHNCCDPHPAAAGRVVHDGRRHMAPGGQASATTGRFQYTRLARWLRAAPLDTGTSLPGPAGRPPSSQQRWVLCWSEQANTAPMPITRCSQLISDFIKAHDARGGDTECRRTTNSSVC
jgi:hypothetical protein